MNVRRPSGLPSVYVRLRPTVAAALEAAALAQNISAAGWARAAIVAGLPDHTHRDFASLPPSPRRRPAVIPPADMAEVSRLIGTVGRATGAVVQLAKTLREHGQIDVHAEVETILLDLRATQSELVNIATRLRASV